jgi:hypothetical protein
LLADVKRDKQCYGEPDVERHVDWVLLCSVRVPICGSRGQRYWPDGAISSRMRYDRQQQPKGADCRLTIHDGSPPSTSLVLARGEGKAATKLACSYPCRSITGSMVLQCVFRPLIRPAQIFRSSSYLTMAEIPEKLPAFEVEHPAGAQTLTVGLETSNAANSP